MKRVVDVLIASIGLILLAPLFAAIAIGVKLTSSGPALFKQDRIGCGGRSFRLYKFRSMVVDAANRGPHLTVGDDPRVTRFGKFLRRAKLDELPQLFNVLCGDMSVVGPRPEVPKYVALYPPEVRDRVLSVRPGLTDQAVVSLDEERILAQATDPEWTYVHEVLPSKLAIYEQYVVAHGLRVDLAIVVRTLLRVALGRRPRTRVGPPA
jgi:lipopolysaccharide/colanic/teichoic acid biosynthesis glycosyltransferase